MPRLQGTGRAAVVGVLTALVFTASAAAARYPVTYSFPHAVASAAKSSTNGPLGANDWSCKPTRAHPYPVVLVHGLMANQVDNWDTMSPLIADNGFCVFALTYGTDPGEPYFGGVEAIEQSAPQLGAFVDRVLTATGANRVDLVGHSEGTVMPRYWMEFLGGAKLVARYVMITPLWHGTNLLGLSTLQSLGESLDPSGASSVLGLFGSTTTCRSCTEFIAGSSFYAKLNGEMALPGVAYTNIMTKYDELVSPYTSGYLAAPGVTNIVLQNQCAQDLSEHLTVAYDPVVAQDVLNALDPSHAGPVPCVPVIPGVGAPFPPATVGLANAAAAPVVRPAWTLRVTPRRVRARRRTRFVFTLRMTVAGVTRPYRGARVAFAGHTLRTDRRGRASAALVLRPRAGSVYRARATVAGRRVASTRVTVRTG
jgi:hypothetical protein